MANRTELITKIAKRKAGKNYLCERCGVPVLKGSDYIRVEVTSVKEGETDRQVQKFCCGHTIKPVLRFGT